MDKHIIPQHLDRPAYYGVFTLAECCIFSIFFILGLLFNQSGYGVMIGAGMLAIKKIFFSNQNLTIILAKLYKNLPISGFVVPHSYKRKYRG